MKKNQMTINKDGVMKLKKQTLIADDVVIVKKARIEAIIEYANKEIVYKHPHHWQELIKMLEDLK